MPLTNTQYDAIMRIYNEKQLRHRRLHDEHVKAAYNKIPQLALIDAKVAEISIAKIRARFSGHPDDTDLPSAIAALSRERQELLISSFIPND